MAAPSVEKLRDELSRDGGKILVIQTAFLGDVILTTPLLRALRAGFPKALLYSLTLPSTKSISTGLVDGRLTYDKHGKNSNDRFGDVLETIKRERFSLAIIPHRSYRSGLLALRSKIPVRIGFNRGAGVLCHTHLIHYPNNLYEGKRNLRLLAILSSHPDSGIPELHPSDEDYATVGRLMSECSINPGKYMVFAPGSVWRTKRWHENSYRELNRLIFDETGLPVLLIGGSSDFNLAERITRDPSFNLCGKLTPLQSAALLKQSIALVSGDTAPAHIATAMGTKQVIIMGSTAPRFGFVPSAPSAVTVGLDLWCRPCTDHGRIRCPLGKSPSCLQQISPQMVFDSILNWII